MLTRLQDNYIPLTPHDILEHEDIVKKTTYHSRDPIATVFSDVEEFLELDNIIGTSYTYLQSVNITYVIIHRMGKFGLAIHEWNHMKTVQKMWVRFR